MRRSESGAVWHSALATGDLWGSSPRHVRESDPSSSQPSFPPILLPSFPPFPPIPPIQPPSVPFSTPKTHPSPWWGHEGHTETLCIASVGIISAPVTSHSMQKIWFSNLECIWKFYQQMEKILAAPALDELQGFAKVENDKKSFFENPFWDWLYIQSVCAFICSQVWHRRRRQRCRRQILYMNNLSVWIVPRTWLIQLNRS